MIKREDTGYRKNDVIQMNNTKTQHLSAVASGRDVFILHITRGKKLHFRKMLS